MVLTVSLYIPQSVELLDIFRVQNIAEWSCSTFLPIFKV
jgi:hypothetical protein